MPTVADLIRRAGRRREGMTVSEYRKRQRRLAWRDEDIVFLPPDSPEPPTTTPPRQML